MHTYGTYMTAGSQAAGTAYHPVLRTVQDCAANCDHMIAMLLGYPDVAARTQQIRLLQDCASICETAACFLARHSGFSRAVLQLCAAICETCGTECSRFPDPVSQHCSHVCLHCAQECRSHSV